IIFDMDGTIIDTENIWKEASKQLISGKNISLSPEQEADLSTQLSGRALPDSCMLIKCLLQLPDDVSALVAQKVHIANNIYPTHANFICGFTEFHALTVQAGLKTAVATNACEETVIIADSSLNLRQFFGPHIYSRAHVPRPKPHPDLY